MRWDGNRESDNVEDRRGEGGNGGGVIGIGAVLIGLVAWLVFDVNPITVINLISEMEPAAEQQAPARASAADDRDAKFIRVMLADTEDVWQPLFEAQGQRYRPPKLVMFSGATPTACGRGDAAIGPFYCPGDEKIYIDLSFFQMLGRELGAPGEFAQAYVIAHEVGHHVQHQLGISAKVDEEMARSDERRANALSVRQELQADCLAGVWGRHADQARQILEQGDLEAALNAAARIGDDALQRSAGREVMPDSFTHGSGEQRVRWFRRGFDSGDMAQCDTFRARRL
ncbi:MULTISPECIES: KPN_02809 family neutral zinc metallopeptidase [Chromobacterium]|uniref:KPN_02809 family neutral zinc metallopeptidase n=1 Tax=Chromobacterium TaxID=535 RepID=UPI000DEFE113|nr:MULTISPECIES: neutral zinc metallopeptidase [Chromobacterium]QOZ84110.1 metalloprotease [Chromobacterium sp. Rain0013]WON84262.1 neutral zinc metallopeptidase [Chromobacterium haemolyticum]